ncbi:FecR family protein [Sphingobacterium hotanense]|uniref:FecR family protein n=1 Tax=Sphingobacterium hotanense TaxID=649196 RepID=UPI0021A90DE7|nr:FecR domain-containing protein [Sphingobacterium hotanense]MCT1523801.1 FecR domain-containing protein [Sphingobacterium hotanense]
MEKRPHTIKQLFYKFLQDRCSPEELSRLYRYFEMDENEEVLKEIILEELDKDIDQRNEVAQEQHLFHLFDQLNEKIQGAREVSLYKRLLGSRWSQVAATIALVAFLAVASYRYMNPPAPIEKLAKSEMDYPQPGSDKAVLTLFNGQQIVLNDAKQDRILKEAGVTVFNAEEGLVVYQVDESVEPQHHNDTQINTISTPRGGQYQIVLADGTKVWLNASSSLEFPSHFSEDSRKVKLTGEAYFEVAHQASKPFFVQTAESEVEVLGTTFNVMAYPEEKTSQITLLTGSVNINKKSETVRLNPGQQAEITRDTKGIRVHKVDLETIVAWKNGVFLFDGSDLQQVMRQVGRWYNAEVEYQDGVPPVKLTGMVSRKDSLEVLLEILERAGGLDVDVQGNKVMVKRLKQKTMKR